MAVVAIVVVALEESVVVDSQRINVLIWRVFCFLVETLF